MKVKVCFVCLGNICRSPTAEGVMRHLVELEGLSDQIGIDSAGTAAYHVGEAPDRRSTATAKRRGITLGGQARAFRPQDFDDFDYVLAMDTNNYADLKKLLPAERRDRLHLFRDFEPESRGKKASVPDPYYGGDRGFEEVLDICERGCRGLLEHLRERHRL